MSEPSDSSRPRVHLIRDLEQVKVLADPLRLRILEPLCLEARTTKQVADLLGEKPTKLYHHIEALERVGLIRLEKTRPKRGTVEKYYRAIADSFRAGPELFSSPEDRDGWPALGGSVLETAASELRALDPASFPEGDSTPALFIGARITASRAQVEAIQSRLEDLLEEVQSLEPDGEEDDYRLVLAYYPTRPSETD